MASFNSWTFTGRDDTGRALAFANAKNTGNRYLLTDVLKTRWGFDGLVVTDWDAIGQVDYADAHGKTQSCTTSSCPPAINAGIDMVMVPFAWKDVHRAHDGVGAGRRDPAGAHRRRRHPHPAREDARRPVPRGRRRERVDPPSQRAGRG